MNFPSWDKSRKRRHKQVYRHIDYFLKKALGNESPLVTIDQIREKLFEETGFHFHTGTLKKYIKKCLTECGEAPLEELYRFNPRYYESKKVKPPRNYSQSEQDQI